MKKIFFLLCLYGTAWGQETNIVKNIKHTKRITCTTVKDQSMSGTCWSFASNSFLESEMIRNHIPVVDLSEMYIARYSYINKIKEHLLREGKTFFTPGGQFHDVVKVVKEYGLMPESAYSGKLNGAQKHDHGILDTTLKYYIKELVEKKVQYLNEAQLAHINATLDKYLGKVPTSFMYKGKAYDPISFAKKIVQLNLDDYVEITSYNHHPMYESIVLEDPYNWSSDKYYNVPYADFINITNAALANNYSICWDGDVTNNGFDYWGGVAKESQKIVNVERYRNKTFVDSVSTIDHMMHIVGIANDSFRNRWYYVKNSWGNNNDLKGYLYMHDDYYKINTVAIIVHKNAIPVHIRKKLAFLK
jgi:bleomycin hydrolase